MVARSARPSKYHITSSSNLFISSRLSSHLILSCRGGKGGSFREPGPFIVHGPPQPPNHAKLLPFLSFLLVSFRLSSLLFVRAAVAAPIGWARRVGLVCGLECRLEAWAAAAAGWAVRRPAGLRRLYAGGVCGCGSQAACKQVHY